MLKMVCVVGDRIAGGAQRLSIPEESFVSLRALAQYLNSVLDFDNAGGEERLRVAQLELYDAEFAEFSVVKSIEELQPMRKMKVRVTTEPTPSSRTAAPLQQSSSTQQTPGAAATAAVAQNNAALQPTQDGALLRATERFLRERDEILFASLLIVAPEAKLEIERIRTASERATRSFIEDPASVNRTLESMQTTANSATARKRMEGGIPARTIQQVDPATVAAAASTGGSFASSRQIASSSSMAMDDGSFVAPAPPSAIRKSAKQPMQQQSSTIIERVAPPPPPASASPVQTGQARLTPMPAYITVFCVYSGTSAQRAKAINVNRLNPDFDKLLSTLESKFKSKLSLGYVDIDTNDFVEITSGPQLAQRIKQQHANDDSVTLHCWRASGYRDNYEANQQRQQSDNDEAYASPPRASYNHSSYVRVRPSSAASVRSTSSRRSRPWDGKNEKGFPSKPEEVEALFHELDADKSGYLDVHEFRRYFDANYDNMGLNDADQKFEKLLAETGVLDDGKIMLDEFMIVLLRMATW